MSIIRQNALTIFNKNQVFSEFTLVMMANKQEIYIYL